MTTRITLVSTSARVAPGLLTAAAWDVLRSARVWTASPEHPQAAALREAGVDVSVLRPAPPSEPGAGLPAEAGVVPSSRAEADPVAELRAVAGPGTHVAWLLDPVSPTAADRALRAALTDQDHSAEPGAVVELLVATRELPGSALLDAVAVMDRLRSPGGCPWDAEQNHVSLAPYLLEEAYEAYQAIEDGDLAELREELGDVLMQVLFHARVAAESGGAGWDVDDVAAGLTAKLIRRHPHVFGDVAVSGADDVVTNWDAIKAQEKGRKSVTEGVPLSAPALFLAAKLLRRAAKLGLPPELALPRHPAGSGAGAAGAGLPGLPGLVAELAREVGTAGPGDRASAGQGDGPGAEAGTTAEERVGDLLFAAVVLAGEQGVDPETALRARARLFRDTLARAEHAALARGEEPGGLAADSWRDLWAAASLPPLERGAAGGPVREA
ncbi:MULTISPECIES: nucleoside triphosphate pyrophosphohydrolase [unclassified Parafrankia]|uniref:nucleoside triphosphate pyrophosphohydrolase n=1 Tax=unclassified Parafrankia TaxID=2994368 RepID=UPI000DA51B9C|nr:MULTISPECIES: nucleoside triphosphate pyrophosphohydrolase [unclassified Parafrankia]TCJ36841.1 nucleoside triphosphate pyrophosphohydrolase [Parafrankia sp. BMG5.11]SQD99187.1 MazG family protein [Parafrankia sp. Ea1.12]